MTCIFTKAIHSRGWTVSSACDFWGIEYNNFRKKCRRILAGNSHNSKEKAQLICMCRGLEFKDLE